MSNQSNKNLIHNWDEYRKSLLDDCIVEQGLSAAEILKHRMYLEAHPLKWIKFFFPKFATAEFAGFHVKAIMRLIANGEWYEVLSWSRELAKSTIIMFVVLYLVLTGKKKNVILTSNSSDNAIRLIEPYRANLDSNPRIIAYYGEQMQIGSWEMGEFKTKSGVSFRALGAGQSPRGTRNDAIRPDIILVDDFDTDEECRNIDIVNKKWDWFEQALYPTRSITTPLLIIFAGNIIAKDCAIVRAGKKADSWDVVNIRDKQEKSTWPEKNTEAHIDRVLSKISTKSGQQEYYNNPVSEGETFKEMHWGVCPPLHKFRFLVSYGDPSPSNNKTKPNSYKSNFLIGMIDGIFYVFTGYLDKATNSEYVEWYYNIEQYVGGKSQLHYFTENNSLQDPLYQQVTLPLFTSAGKEKGHYLSVVGDERKKPDKYSRIEGTLEPLNRQNRLILNIEEKNNPHMIRLEEQFLLVNPRLNSPADGPDCVEGGVFICNTKNLQLSAESIKFGKRQTNKKRV